MANSTTRILGTLHADGERGVVRMEDRVEAPIDEVWSALTEPARLAVWLGELEGDFLLGGEYRAHYHASGWEGTGRITAFDAPKHLRVDVRESQHGEERGFEVWLSADGDATRVVWEERGMPAAHLAAYGAGIQIHVEDLAAYLAGHDIDHGRAPARFDELFAPYQEVEIA